MEYEQYSFFTKLAKNRNSCCDSWMCLRNMSRRFRVDHHCWRHSIFSINLYLGVLSTYVTWWCPRKRTALTAISSFLLSIFLHRTVAHPGFFREEGAPTLGGYHIFLTTINVEYGMAAKEMGGGGADVKKNNNKKIIRNVKYNVGTDDRWWSIMSGFYHEW